MRGLAKKIELQTQPTHDTCTQTCIAMALGVPVADLGVCLGNGTNFEDFGVYLAERGVWMRQCVHMDGKGEAFQQGRVYLITMRSLNKIGIHHAILLDARGEPELKNFDVPSAPERNGWKFFDPNTGREGKQTYEWVWECEAVDFCELRDRSTPGVIAAGEAP